ncbi:unnamed protein product [Bursaphelenchus okinawaensis]|uniref:Fungal lipase-type domain-containing protein n=1 Tax=Bursaphelenchus okinawaensis TaxID=465554 RepID=A0A811JR91_9BILA|nr:unnamed protein product [Bursaphelenchus okinawaensis]CAG9079514.1 unnamed protein product [Bursaphelenchus okinawaensis]
MFIVMANIICFQLISLLIAKSYADLYDYYDDALARRMLILSAGAYHLENPEYCITNHFGNVEMVQLYKELCAFNYEDLCASYMALLHDDKVIAIVFRGTVKMTQLMDESFSGFEAKERYYEIGDVNVYFNSAFRQIWVTGMSDVFDEIRQQYPIYTVWVTGHSFGGALTSLLAPYLICKYGYNATNLALYTFGQPRVGDDDYAYSHSEMIPWFFRVVHNQDVVAEVFPEALGYKHHSTEVWYGADMSPGAGYTICGYNYGAVCEKPLGIPSKEDHSIYFNKFLSKYGRLNCTLPISVSKLEKLLVIDF